MSEVDDTPDEIRWLYANGGNHPNDVARWLKENTPEQLAAEYKRHRAEYEAAVAAEIAEKNVEIEAINTEERKKPAKDRKLVDLIDPPVGKADAIAIESVASAFVALDQQFTEAKR